MTSPLLRGPAGLPRGLFDNAIRALAVVNNGAALVVGGDFVNIGELTVNHVATHPGGVGHPWLAMGGGLNASVYALAEYQGSCIAAGMFVASAFQ